MDTDDEDVDDIEPACGRPCPCAAAAIIAASSLLTDFLLTLLGMKCSPCAANNSFSFLLGGPLFLNVSVVAHCFPSDKHFPHVGLTRSQRILRLRQ